MWTIFVHNGQWKCERKNEPHTIWVVLSSLSIWKYESNTLKKHYQCVLKIHWTVNLSPKKEDKVLLKFYLDPPYDASIHNPNKRCFIQTVNLMEHLSFFFFEHVSWWYFRKIKHVFMKWYHPRVTNSLRRRP